MHQILNNSLNSLRDQDIK